MSSRAKIISLVALLTIVFAAAFWWLRRDQSTQPPAPATQSAETVASNPRSDEIVSAPSAPRITSEPARTVPHTASTATALPPEVPAFVIPGVNESAQPDASEAVAAPAPTAEIAATARMYAAHAPLRSPEVADPDSAANRQILSTMVTKALAQPATPPPAAPGTR